MKTNLLYFVVLAAALVSLSTTSAATFNLISDIHLDPAYGTSTGYKCTTSSDAALGQSGCDSPTALLNSLVTDASSQRSAYTVYCGDFQRHGFSASGLTAANVFGAAAAGLASITTDGSIPTPNVISTLGNNDVVPDYTFDYATVSSNTEFASRVDLLFSKGLINAAEQTEMMNCGYYSRTLSSGLTFISLHTLLWTYKVTPTIADTVTDPCGQFAFLSTQLATAKAAGNKVIIIGHIPPTPDVYDIVANGAYTSESADMYWKAAYVTQFNTIVSAYTDTIVLQLYGHSHQFTLGAYSSMNVPMFIVPAVSPIYANRPSYLIADFDDNWKLRGLWQRYLSSSNVWTDGMSILGAMGLNYGFSSMTSLQSAAARVMTDATVWANFLTVHAGGESSLAVFPKSTCNTFCRAVTVAAMSSSSYSDQKALTTTYQSAATTTTKAPAGVDVNLSGSIVTTVLILGCVVAVAVILVLMYCIPRCRSGAIKMKMPDIDWKAELLNCTPKKEKIRMREEKEMRRQEREEQRLRDLAGGQEDGVVRIDVDESRPQDTNSTDPNFRTRE